MTSSIPHDRIRPVSDKLPPGISISAEAGVYWVTDNGVKRVSAPSYVEAHRQAWLLAGHHRRRSPFEVMNGGLPGTTGWPEIGMFEGRTDQRDPPRWQMPRFTLRDWRPEIGIDFAAWLLWRLVAKTENVREVALQIDPLTWGRYYMTTDRGAPLQPVRGKVYIDFWVFWDARKRLQRLIEVIG